MIINLKIVRVNPEYCEYLRKFDDKVSYNKNEKERRPFIGILFEIDTCKYFAPLASPKLKHMKMKNTLDFFKIKNGKLGAINFNNMIPVKEENYNLINLDKKEQKETEYKYQKLLREQLTWLNAYYYEVKNKSLKLYKSYNAGKLPDSIRKRCCNFKLLEEKCIEYNKKGWKTIMKITNSMTGKKEEFKPIEEGKVKMYACGITVYDLSHIGHARQAIVYAMITDYLRYRGYDVKYVRNYTDVDDKIIKRANELGKDALEFSKEQIEETEKDMAGLHITDADVYTKASEYIEKIIKFVEGLIEKGYAYPTPTGDVYYKVRDFKGYGKLSHRNVDELLNGVRIDLEEGKEDPLDFALWKSAKPGEVSWDSPWGKGRPGWHIECSCMAIDNLGETIDIHGGGRDLIFPHHENEIAQSEALTGKPFAHYWSHCGLIKINGEKMSKSLGNSLTIRDALKMYNYEVLKYVMHSKHYSSDMDILDSDYTLAESHTYYFYNTIKKMQEFIKQYSGNENDEILEDETVTTIKEKFIEAMDDDFNTTAAIANLHIVFKYINNLIKTAKKDNRQKVANTLAKMWKDIAEVYGILGFFEQEPEKFIEEMKEKYLKKINMEKSFIEEKIAERKEAKASKNYELADSIRAELDGKGIILNDTVEGTTWDIKELY